LLLALLLGTAWLTLWSLGSLPLTDVDEPVYGQVGREMARAGWAGWLTPHLGGQPWFDKPPLFYWLSALSMRAWGVSEWSARLPSAVLAVALVAATHALARRCFPQERRAGLWAGFALATCVQFFLLARAAVTDMTLALTLTLALGALYVWTQTGRGRWVALAGAMTGLAALTKGPVALVLIGVQAVAYLLLTRQPRRLLSAALWGGLALCLLVALPWYGAMIRLHGRLFVDGFLGANNVTRYLQAEHSATSSPLFFVPVLLGGFFPWSLLLPGASVVAWRQGRAVWAERKADNPALFLGLWIALVFVFFSASQSKLITYIFPLYPAAAVLVGAWLASAVHTQEAKIATRAETSRLFVPLGLYVALSLALVILLFSVRAKYGVDHRVGECLGGDDSLLPGAGAARLGHPWRGRGLAAAVRLVLADVADPGDRGLRSEAGPGRLARRAAGWEPVRPGAETPFAPLLCPVPRRLRGRPRSGGCRP